MAGPYTRTAPSGAPFTAGRLTGPQAAVWKYDLLTAISVFALGQGGGLQTTLLRLLAAVTARYDWRRDELSIGRVELGRLWQCSEPTVKRELRKLRDMRILVQLRPGVRGRVAAYRLSRQTIEGLTRDHWVCVGPDFAQRMGQPELPDGNVVAFPQPTPDPALQDQMPPWAEIVCEGNPAVFRNWFSEVSLHRDGPVADYQVPSAFVATHLETRFQRQMLAAARYMWPEVQSIRVTPR